MKNRKMAIVVCIILVLIAAALYIYIYTIPKITGALTETCIVEFGQMKISKAVSAVLIREETLYSANASGQTSYYLENNTKTRKDIKILDIYGGSTNSVLCPVTGVVSYYYDGYESSFTHDSIPMLKELLPKDSAVEVKDARAERLNVQDPMFKLITSDSFDTVFFINPNEYEDYKLGSAVTLEFETGSVKARISDIIPIYAEEESVSEAAITLEEPISESEPESDDLQSLEGGEDVIEKPIESYIVVVTTAKYFKDYDKLRICNVNVVLRDDKGLLIPNTAIAEVDGNSGVYVKGIDGDYDFTRIKVINSDGKNSIVYADNFSVLREDGLTDTIQTISIYDEILKDASEKN